MVKKDFIVIKDELVQRFANKISREKTRFKVAFIPASEGKLIRSKKEVIYLSNHDNFTELGTAATIAFIMSGYTIKQKGRQTALHYIVDIYDGEVYLGQLIETKR